MGRGDWQIDNRFTLEIYSFYSLRAEYVHTAVSYSWNLVKMCKNCKKKLQKFFTFVILSRFSQVYQSDQSFWAWIPPKDLQTTLIIETNQRQMSLN